MIDLHLEATLSLESSLSIYGDLMNDRLDPEVIQQFGPFYSPGGGDIDPSLYGDENTFSGSFRSEIDKREFDMVKRILEQKQPLLAICRGHQIVGAVIGAKLHQDLHAEGFRNHHHGPVRVEEDSLMERIFFKRMANNFLQVNSLHHQAIRENTLPPNWRVTARSGDGVVEAIEHPDLPVISVQWHPEMIGWQLRLIGGYFGCSIGR